MPSTAPGSKHPLINSMVKMMYGMVAVTYTTWNLKSCTLKYRHFSVLIFAWRLFCDKYKQYSPSSICKFCELVDRKQTMVNTKQNFSYSRLFYINHNYVCAACSNILQCNIYYESHCMPVVWWATSSDLLAMV